VTSSVFTVLAMCATHFNFSNSALCLQSIIVDFICTVIISTSGFKMKKINVPVRYELKFQILWKSASCLRELHSAADCVKLHQWQS
jgi:hypothetical protein